MRPFLATFFLVFFLAAPVHAAEFKGRCIAVIDGDSLVVQRKGRPVEVRLWGVDAPKWGPAVPKRDQRVRC